MRIAPDVRAAILAQAPALAEARVPPQLQGFARHATQFAYETAFLHGLRVVLLVACGLALASAPCAVWTIDCGKQKRDNAR